MNLTELPEWAGLSEPERRTTMVSRMSSTKNFTRFEAVGSSFRVHLTDAVAGEVLEGSILVDSGVQGTYDEAMKRLQAAARQRIATMRKAKVAEQAVKVEQAPIDPVAQADPVQQVAEPSMKLEFVTPAATEDAVNVVPSQPIQTLAVQQATDVADLASTVACLAITTASGMQASVETSVMATQTKPEVVDQLSRLSVGSHAGSSSYVGREVSTMRKGRPLSGEVIKESARGFRCTVRWYDETEETFTASQLETLLFYPHHPVRIGDDFQAEVPEPPNVKRRRNGTEQLRLSEATKFCEADRHSKFEMAILFKLPMRLSFQETLGLKSASSVQLVDILHRLTGNEAMADVRVVMLNGMPGFKGEECMRALVGLLTTHTMVHSLNLGERNGCDFSPPEYNILCTAIESNLTGLALGWIENQLGALATPTGEKRFNMALHNNRERLQTEARQIFKLTGRIESALQHVPWRDPAYRERLSRSCPGLGIYTAMGQHQLRHGVEAWGEAEFLRHG